MAPGRHDCPRGREAVRKNPGKLGDWFRMDAAEPRYPWGCDYSQPPEAISDWNGGRFCWVRSPEQTNQDGRDYLTGWNVQTAWKVPAIALSMLNLQRKTLTP